MEFREGAAGNLLSTGSKEVKDGCLRTHHLNMMCARGNEVPRPEIHGFCDSQGVFHMFEGVEGKRIVMAMKALEERILAKVEKSLVGMREEMKSESAGLEKEVKDIAAEQKEFCSKVDDVSMEAFESRSDLLDRLEEISREALESRIDHLKSIEDIETKIKDMQRMQGMQGCASPCASYALPQAMANFGTESLETQLERDILQQNNAEMDIDMKFDHAEGFNMEIESLEAQLEQEILLQNGADFVPARHVLRDPDAIESLPDVPIPEKIEIVQADTDAPNQQAIEKDGPDVMETSACSLDLARQPSSKLTSKAHDQDMWSPSSINWMSGASYSNKISVAGVSYSRKPASFAQGFNVHRPRPVGRMTSCHSAPLLQPLF
jgi:hypothetical protein